VLLNAERADVLKTDVERVVCLMLLAVAVALAERVFGRYTPAAGTMTDDGITGADHCLAVPMGLARKRTDGSAWRPAL
jgi:hypothetical protein